MFTTIRTKQKIVFFLIVDVKILIVFDFVSKSIIFVAELFETLKKCSKPKQSARFYIVTHLYFPLGQKIVF